MDRMSMNLKQVYKQYQQWFWLLALLLLAVLSFSLIAESSWIQSLNQDLMAYLDDKKLMVTSLTAATALSSFGIEMIPGDAGNAIAENIADLSGYLLVVLAAIWLQKYLVGLIGLLTFKVLLPLALLLFAGNIFWKKEKVKQIANKLLILAAVLFITIPSSVMVSRQIEETHSQSIEQTIKEVDETNSKIQKEAQTEEGFFGQVSSAITDLTDSVMNFVSTTIEETKVQFSQMIDAVAVLLITTCVIPILVFAFFLWAIRLIFGLDIKLSLPKERLFRKGRKDLHSSDS